MKHANTIDRSLADVSIAKEGSIITFTLNTEAAKDWVEDNVQAESWRWMGRSLCVDYRDGAALREGMEDDGLVVE
jgi:hypothetical protein